MKKILILTMLCLIILVYQNQNVSAYDPDTNFYFDNLITNGDFEDTLNSWYFNNSIGVNTTWENGTKGVSISGDGTTLNPRAYQYGIPTVANSTRELYIHFEYLTYTDSIAYSIYFGGGSTTPVSGNIITTGVNTGGTWLTYDSYHTITTNNSDSLILFFASYYDNLTDASNSVAKLRNVTIIDLTNSFEENIPTLEVFENEYLPLCTDYFDTCDNYIWQDLTAVDSVSHPDLDSIDFNKSIISYYGANMDIDMYFSMVDLNVDTSSTNFVLPVIRYEYAENIYTLSLTKLNQRYYKVEFSDMDKIRIKRILFNRVVDSNYFEIIIPENTDPYGTPDREWSYFFDFHTQYAINVSLKSFYVDYDMRPINSSYDIYGSLISSSNTWSIIMTDNEGLQLGNANYFNYGSGGTLGTLTDKYTNVASATVSLKPSDYTTDSVYDDFSYKINEIGIFASEDVQIPDKVSYVDTSTEYIQPDYQICGKLDLFCQGSNLIQKTIYDNSMSRSVQDILTTTNGTINTYFALFDAFTGIFVFAYVIGLTIIFFLLRQLSK